MSERSASENVPTPLAPAQEPRADAALSTSIVIPAFNEASRLGDGLARFFDAVRSGVIDQERTEVIVVDDGSADGTADRAAVLLDPLPHHRIVQLPSHQGKGAAVRAGIKQARAGRVVFMDADMAIEPTQVGVLLATLADHEIAIGCRALPGSSVDSKSWVRDVGAAVFNSAVNLLTDLNLKDTQCGFKAFRTPAARLMFHFSTSDGFACDVEVLLRAHQLGLSVGELPVTWRRVSGSRIRLLDPWHMLFDVMRTRRPSRTQRVPAVTISRSEPMKSDLGTEVARRLGPTVPVITVSDGDVRVLFPLTDDDETKVLVNQLQRALNTGPLHLERLTFDQVRTFAPLTQRLVAQPEDDAEHYR